MALTVATSRALRDDGDFLNKMRPTSGNSERKAWNLSAAITRGVGRRTQRSWLLKNNIQMFLLVQSFDCTCIDRVSCKL